jgi:Lrp/AsnC family transcriptional regulator for asnA, asnC and gidA
LDSVDDIDLQIIRCLQDNPRAPYATVARMTGVSETTVKRRVDDLIARRAIRPAMIANIYRLGYRTRATVGLKVDLQYMLAVANALVEMPETAYVAFTSGEYNVSCLVAVQSLEGLTRFMLDKIAPLEGITATQVLVVPRILKSFADWRVPIALHPESDEAGEDVAFAIGAITEEA